MDAADSSGGETTTGALLTALGRQQQIVQFGVAAIAALIAFAETRGDAFVGALMFNLVPLAALTLLVLWHTDSRRILDLFVDRTGRRRDQILDLWAQEPRRLVAFSVLVGAAFVAAAAVGVLLGFHELDVAKRDPETDDPNLILWIGWWTSVVFTVACVVEAIRRGILLRMAR